MAHHFFEHSVLPVRAMRLFVVFLVSYLCQGASLHALPDGARLAHTMRVTPATLMPGESVALHLVTHHNSPLSYFAVKPVVYFQGMRLVGASDDLPAGKSLSWDWTATVPSDFPSGYRGLYPLIVEHFYWDSQANSHRVVGVFPVRLGGFEQGCEAVTVAGDRVETLQVTNTTNETIPVELQLFRGGYFGQRAQVSLQGAAQLNVASSVSAILSEWGQASPMVVLARWQEGETRCFRSALMRLSPPEAHGAVWWYALWVILGVWTALYLLEGLVGK